MKTVKVDDDLHKTAKIAATTRGMTLETFVADALRYWAIVRLREPKMTLDMRPKYEERKAAAGKVGAK